MATSAQFRHEHIARAPRGWRVRTVTRGPHEVRIAFPPGRRKKGSGRVVEILHPKGENNPKCEISEKAKKNPGELLIFGNPSYVHFTLNGREYRTDGKTVEGKDGQTWNRTGSINVVLEARKQWAAQGGKNPDRGKQRVARQRAERIRSARLNPTRVQLRKRIKALEAKFYPAMDRLAAARRAHGIMSPEYMAIEKETEKLSHDLDLARRLHSAAINPRRNPKPKSGSTRGGRRSSGSRRLTRNPSEETKAVALYQSFHGRDPKEIVDKHVSAAVRLEYAALGDLEYIKVITPIGQKAEFRFDGDKVKLASSPDGKQLYVIGGNQDLSRCLDAESREKDFIDLGEAQEVQYLARKVHAGFKPVSYYHKFGEVNGAKPQLMFDKLKRQIFFIGGEYFIDTSKGVSPGIEN